MFNYERCQGILSLFLGDREHLWEVFTPRKVLLYFFVRKVQNDTIDYKIESKSGKPTLLTINIVSAFRFERNV
jgi:hypothetical protein